MSENEGFVAVCEDKDLNEGSASDPLEVQEISIILIKMFNGEIYAVNSQCPHLGRTLSNGWRGDYEIGCYAGCCGLRFDIRTGKNIGAPESGLDLRTYECRVKDGKICVKL
jgi:nitrite reductase/ring-hydroxylating ferredoxin subunit